MNKALIKLERDNNWHDAEEEKPLESGWYVVHKKDVSSPCLLRFSALKESSAWDRVTFWAGPVLTLSKYERGE